MTKDQRSATATATFELTASNPPVVDVDASAHASRRVAAQGGVVLYGAVAPGGGGGLLNSSWSARTTETAWLAGANLAEGLDLDAYAETAIALAPRAGAYQHNLVLAPGALVDGATYVFELSATFDGVLGAASVELVAVSAPTAGSCSVVPTRCVALDSIHRPRDEVRRLYLFMGCCGPSALLRVQGITWIRCRLDAAPFASRGDGRGRARCRWAMYEVSCVARATRSAARARRRST